MSIEATRWVKWHIQFGRLTKFWVPQTQVIHSPPSQVCTHSFFLLIKSLYFSSSCTPESSTLFSSIVCLCVLSEHRILYLLSCLQRGKDEEKPCFNTKARKKNCGEKQKNLYEEPVQGTYLSHPTPTPLKGMSIIVT